MKTRQMNIHKCPRENLLFLVRAINRIYNYNAFKRPDIEETRAKVIQSGDIFIEEETERRHKQHVERYKKTESLRNAVEEYTETVISEDNREIERLGLQVLLEKHINVCPDCRLAYNKFHRNMLEDKEKVYRQRGVVDYDGEETLKQEERLYLGLMDFDC